MGNLRYLAFIGIAVWLASPRTEAATMTWTGLDLLNDPGVFVEPIGTTVSGTSLIFGSPAVSDGKLVVVPLFPAGTYSSSDSVAVSVALNLTRLDCVGNCAAGAADFDPHSVLGDGSHLVGAITGDNNGGQFWNTTLIDAGPVGSSRTLDVVFSGAGFPAPLQSFDVLVDFLLEPGQTTVEAAFLSGSGSFVNTARALDATQDIFFVFMRDNENGERYQLNTLAIDTCSPFPGGGQTGGCFPGPGPFPGKVPEPTTLLLLALGLAGLGFARKRLH